MIRSIRYNGGAGLVQSSSKVCVSSCEGSTFICEPRGFLANEKHPYLSGTLRGYSSLLSGPLWSLDNFGHVWYVLCRHFSEIEPFGLTIRGVVPQRSSS